jgi:hypothetical protein
MTVAPTVHFNGTTASDLIAQLREAYAAIGVASKTLQRAAPHGRDYYPQGDHAFAAARDAHLLRIAKLESVREELLELSFAVRNQLKEKL